MLRTVTEILIKNVDTSDKRRDYHGSLLFDSSTIPPIGIGAYIRRLHAHFDCSESCHIMALIYLDHFREATDRFRLTVRNVHRLYLAALLLATKFSEDTYYDNNYYAKCGGIRLSELNRLELTFLRVVDFRLTVPSDEYEAYLDFIKIKHTMWVDSTPHIPNVLSRLETESDNEQMSEKKQPLTPSSSLSTASGSAGSLSEFSDVEPVSELKRWNEEPSRIQ